MQNDFIRECPRCKKPMEFVREVPFEVLSGVGSSFQVPIASDIFRCAEHGLYRAFISGDVRPHIERGEQGA